MTPEDLQAIRAIVREEFAAAEERITHATAGNLSDLRAELISRIEELSRRMETLEQRVERRFDILTPAILSVDARIGPFTRVMEQINTGYDQATNTLTAQQRAIDQLSARVAKLERELHPEKPQ